MKPLAKEATHRFSGETMSRARHGFYFIWQTDSSVRTATLDIIFEHRRGGLNLRPETNWCGDACDMARSGFLPPKLNSLICWQKRAGNVPDRHHNFYAWRTSCSSWGPSRRKGLRLEFLPRRWKTRVVEICATGTIETELDDLHRDLWHNGVSRRPLRMIRHLTDECRRGVRQINSTHWHSGFSLGPRWCRKEHTDRRPPGCIWCLISSVDGSSIGDRRRSLDEGTIDSVTDPHGQVPRGTLISMAYLAAFFVDNLDRLSDPGQASASRIRPRSV